MSGDAFENTQGIFNRVGRITLREILLHRVLLVQRHAKTSLIQRRQVLNAALGPRKAGLGQPPAVAGWIHCAAQ